MRLCWYCRAVQLLPRSPLARGWMRSGGSVKSGIRSTVMERTSRPCLERARASGQDSLLDSLGEGLLEMEMCLLY